MQFVRTTVRATGAAATLDVYACSALRSMHTRLKIAVARCFLAMLAGNLLYIQPTCRHCSKWSGVEPCLGTFRPELMGDVPPTAPASVASTPLTSAPASKLRAVNDAAVLVLKHALPDVRATGINPQRLRLAWSRIAKCFVAHSSVPLVQSCYSWRPKGLEKVVLALECIRPFTREKVRGLSCQRL
jgi:hypothetical protein